MLSSEIAVHWRRLGRCLGLEEAKLHAINKDHDLLFEQGYHMLTHWKKMKGSAATYQALFDGLEHGLVNRPDLAEKFCCVHGNIFYNI